MQLVDTLLLFPLNRINTLLTPKVNDHPQVAQTLVTPRSCSRL